LAFAKKSGSLAIMIEVKRISVRMGGRQILHDISLEVNPGEVVAVVGPNGAGKSTLLNAIAGGVSISAGSIRIAGRAPGEWTEQALARVRAVLRQHQPAGFPLSVIELACLGRYPHCERESRARGLSIAFWALKQVGLTHLAGRDIHTLSGGERQRAHFARVLTQLRDPDDPSPRYIFLDEPLASLDIAQQHRLSQLVRQAARQWRWGAMVIVHDLNLAAQYADRMILLHQGRVVARGLPETTLTECNLREVFEVEAHIGRHPRADCPQIVIYQASTPQNLDYHDFH
jgi:iron complex transport system ATP-binding protein